MATVTPNFNFPVPQSTDLVKDGATAIASLGTSIDTQFVDLKGGTTGQVLAKASNTDLDYTWVAQDDSNAIQNAIVDAKGDLIGATAADTPARLAVGTNGQVLTADSTAATGLAWATVSTAESLGFTAGKNKLINGDFNIWQRGTSFSGSSQYTADRWLIDADTSGFSQSRQAFTAGTAPVTGYEGTFFMRTVRGTGGSYCNSQQRIEDVRTFANQTVTLSFWAKASAFCTIEPYYIQNFGSGGSGAVSASFGTTTTLTTSWVRYTYTVAIPSVSGKTIGTSSYLNILVARITSATNVDVDTWGVQIEAGSTATSFQTATGTIQGELSACQRYYYKHEASGTVNTSVGAGGYYGSTTYLIPISFPVTMRTAPTFSVATVTNGYAVLTNGGLDNINSLTQETANTRVSQCYNNTEAAGTTGFYGQLTSQNASTSLAWSAEL